jgi:hypothetical protein
MHEDVILEGSVFGSPITGSETVRNAMRQSSNLYDGFGFKHETQSADRTYFGWEEAALGMPVWGVTALTLGVVGRISRVVVSCRPLDVVNRFSAALADRLAPLREPKTRSVANWQIGRCRITDQDPIPGA